jgi:hypothetical protein
MKNLLRASLLGLPLVLVPSQAYGWGKGGYAHQVGAGYKCVIGLGSMPQAGPWYLYWPYEAHFNASAPGFGTGCAPCGMSWGWMGGNYGGAMGWDASQLGGGGYGGYGGYGGGGAPCAGGSCLGANVPKPQQYNMPQYPAAPRPNTHMPAGYPASWQPTAYSGQVPSYWYGR